ncbi:ATP-binding cassette domain-containing protein [Desulfosarcina sp. OttesenSCG-928-A07]|nr:ATP-binding cassette domain-containing protein [Desulfosarcina sp. OttesenSCG-928-A07]
MITCRNLTFQYPSADALLFSGLDLTFDRPGFHALFGPSGIGKTTLAKIISGDLKASSGTVTLTTEKPCLYTFNRERLPGWSPVGRHIEKTTPAGREALREKLIPLFGLSDLLGLRFSQLSMGQCNRVNLLRYLLQDFDVLIMDESLANVDEPTRQAILYTLKTLFPKRLFLYISHNVVEVARFCDEIAVFRGAHQIPPVLQLPGLNHLAADPEPGADVLSHVMLEIMNAV